MAVSPEGRKAFYDSVCAEIVKEVARMIGTTANTLAGTVQGIILKKESLSTSDAFGPKNLEELVNVYVKIIGPVAKTLAGRAVVRVKEVGEDEERAELLPNWLAESVKALSGSEGAH
ncbi:MAG: hypothetical protein V1820_05630 [archaeon]